MTRKAKAREWFQRVVLRGIEGIIADKYLEKIVNSEWRNADEADEAMRCQFEARNMAEAVYADLLGHTK